MPPQKTRKRSVGDIVAVIGFLVIGIIVIWGLIHAGRLSVPWIRSLFPEKAQSLMLSAPKSALDGEAFTVTWKYTPKEDGHYVFLYQCQEAVQLKTISVQGTEITIPCGAAFTVGTTDNKIALTPHTTAQEKTDVKFSIIFAPANAASARVQGGASISVVPTETQKPATEKPTTPAKAEKPTAPGKPDLKVQILTVGVIDPMSGAFIARAPMNPGEMSAVQFDIANVGTAQSGNYFFEVYLPTMSPYTYFSPAQTNLGPGDHVVSTIRFTDAAPQGGIVSVQVDPLNLVSEKSEGNNYASQQLSFPYSYPMY